jgi:hypothetical protein
MMTKIIAVFAAAALGWAGIAVTHQGNSGRSCCPTGGCCVLDAPCCNLPQTSASDETVPSCCYPGSECCYPGSPCCNGTCCPNGSCCPNGPCCGNTGGK